MKIKIISYFMFLLMIFSCDSALVSDNNGANPVLSGSYSNMLTIGDYLYAINKAKLVTFDVTNSSDPVIIDEQELGFNLESLLFHKGNLFIGSSDAMYIYTIGEDGVPERVSVTDYFLNDFDGCKSDPIVVKGNYAYVTLSTATINFCNRVVPVNQLQVYNIADLQSPSLLKRIDMIQPKGLGIDGNLLFVCEATDGVQVFDISIPESPELIDHYGGFNAFDVIAENGLLIIVGPKKLYEFSYSEMGELAYLSDIDI